MDELITTVEPETETKRMTIQIRVTPEEYAILSRLADEAHLKIGTYVRSFVLTHNAQKQGENCAK